MAENQDKKIELPLIPLRGLAVFPIALLSFQVSRLKSKEALGASSESNDQVFLIAQKDAMVNDPKRPDLYDIGVIANIKQTFRLQDNSLHVIAEGVCRAKLNKITQKDRYMSASLTIQDDFNIEEPEKAKALMQETINQFEQYVKLNSKIPPENIISVLSAEEPGMLSDLVASSIDISYQERQALLETLSVSDRLYSLLDHLVNALYILELQADIVNQVKKNVDKTQKEYYLKEQLKIIREELGEGEDVESETEAIRSRLRELEAPAYVMEKVEAECRKLLKTPFSSPEAMVIRNYIDWILELPWNINTKESKDLLKAEKILNSDHYGLTKVKTRILEYIAVRNNTPTLSAPILCFVGPPGVGKTSVAKSIAKALNRKFVQISFGGVRDEADIRGHRRTYIGSMPGRVLYAMKQAKTVNPLILMDEIDKMGMDIKGDPSAALLEVLDMEQNARFRDHYLEMEYDLSQVIFVCTANSVDRIHPALKDRLEMIQMESYTDDEKISIASKYLLEKQRKFHGLSKSQLKLDEKTMMELINGYTKESGVRQLERFIGALCRKAVWVQSTAEKKSLVVKPGNLEELLGPKKYHRDQIAQTPEIGLAKGLAWTLAGGDTLNIEANVMKGTGKVQLTGNMGNVMKESAHAAVSYVRSKADDLHIPANFYKQNDIHIHIPEGAVPKDGPSAGITLATAIVSALTETPVKNDIAMTGEITLRGNVLPIGGLKEKLMAANRAGIKKVLLPSKNEKDLDEISDRIKKGLDFVLVQHMNEVLENALVHKPSVKGTK